MVGEQGLHLGAGGVGESVYKHLSAAAFRMKLSPYIYPRARFQPSHQLVSSPSFTPIYKTLDTSIPAWSYS